jgi:phosphoglycerol transferase MdoB-like AlkP superfamily enzyme
MKESQSPISKRPWRAARVGAIGALTSAGISLVSHWLFASSSLSPWIALDCLVETFFFVGLFIFCRSIKVTIAAQVLLDLLFQVSTAVKVSYLGMPILPTDFYLIRDAVQILPWPTLALYAVIVLVPLGLFITMIVRSWRWPKGVAYLALLPLLAYCTWLFGFPESYSDTFNLLLKNEMFGIPFLVKERSEALGVPLSFSIDLAKFLMVERTRPSSDQVRKTMTDLGIQTNAETSATFPDSKKRNVYILLTESFWNPAEMLPEKGTSFLTPEFQTLWNANGHHHMLSPMFGGGTANVEFEMLCGIPARIVNKGIIFQVALANHVDCLPNLLKQLGYRTFAFHPFAPGYYNRNIAFPLLGFEDFISIKDFKPDADSDSFIGDNDFLHESVRRARALSDGKPFLAYMMTFAGHWPFAWLPHSYEKKIELPGKDVQPDLEILERHLNINRISSDVLAKMSSEILASDPTALIVITGDHLPGLAKDLFSIQNSEDIRDWHFYQTPLIFADPLHPDIGNLPPEVPAYRLGAEILNRLEVPKSSQGHFPWFQPPLLIRPVQNGATLVKSETSDYQICTSASHSGDCPKAYDWLRQVHILGIDLVSGSQHSLHDALRLPATAEH